MAKVLNEERFNPSRLPGLSLWLDAQATTTIASTAAGVSSWSDRSDSGNTFTTSSTQTGPLVFTQQTGGFPTPTLFTSITSGADGTKLAAATQAEGVYISTDSGTTWTPTSLAVTSRPYQSITSSADGTKLAVVASGSGGGLFVSSNSGSTWTSISITGFTNLRCVVFSADGSTAALVLGGSLTGKIYVSTDSGSTWVNNSTTGSGLPTTAGWTSITSSANGSKLAAVVLAGGIYTSSNYGTTWVQRTSGLPTTANWFSIASSANGNYLAATANGSAIYTSANSGESWTTRGLASGLPGTASWRSITSSSDGKYLVATSDDKGIYTSVDYGENWTKQTSGLPATASWRSITSSADGSKLAVVNTAGGIYTRSSFVSTWMQQIPCPIPLNWQTISSSADGSKLAAAVSGGGLYTSVDYGSTWTLRGSGLPSSAAWRSIASSADGIKLAAVPFSGQIYTSTDSGATWVTRTSGITPATLPWICIASSADGTILAAVSGATSGRLYISTDSGSSWTPRGETGNWNSIASSADGKNLAAAINSGGIYTSSDYGTTWVKKESGLPATETWRTITSSADGSKLAALVEFGGGIYTSVDYGSTWVKQTSGLPSGGTWYSITSASDWSKLAVAKVDGGIYTSTDSGVTWAQQTSVPSAKWYSIAYSADGTTLAGVVYIGGIYTSYRPQYTFPVISNTAIISQPSIFFPPGAQMISTLCSGLVSSKSIFIAYQTPFLTSTMRFATGNDVSGGAFGFSQTQYYVSAPYQYDYGNTRWTTNTVLYTLPTVLSGIYDASSGIIRGDRNFNADADVRETATINIISNTPYSIGASPIASSIVTSASFHVCEIIAYNRALATTDRQMIEGYIAWKWGITNQLPIGHPYKEFPPSGEQVIIPSTPANVMQGLISWLDMADTSSYTLSGTTLNTLKDKASGTLFTISGKPNNFSFSNIGSLPALVFPGNNTSSISANTFLFRTIPVPSQGSACMVLVPNSQFTATKLGVLGWGSPLNSGGNIAVGYNSPTNYIQTLQSYNTSSGTFFGPSLNFTANIPTILFWAWYGGNMVYFSCNGTTLLTSARAPTTYYNSASTDTQFYIGNDGGFGAQFTLGELVMYNQYGETPFRNLIEGHLAWKWGLQTNLPAYHPYYYSAPGLQSLTEVNALSQPSDIDGLTMWLDAADTTTLTLTPSFVWIDKSSVANHVYSTTSGNAPTPSNFGTARRPSIYFGPGKTAVSTYNSGASTSQFSTFIVASVPTLSYLLISTGQYTTATTPVANQSFAFYGSNGALAGVCSPFVGGGGTKVGPYSTICGATVEMFASVSGLTTLGNLNFGSTVSGTCGTIPATPWVFGDCLGDPSPKSFHVHEFITYSRQLATNERWVIEGYLYWKWMHLI